MQKYVWGPFVAGSAYPVILFPVAYLFAYAYEQGGAPPWSWDLQVGVRTVAVAMLLPLALGLYNILFVALSALLPGRSFLEKHWLGGFFLGAALPVAGMLMGEPRLLFGEAYPLGVILVPVNMMAFGVLWRALVGPINRRLTAR